MTILPVSSLPSQVIDNEEPVPVPSWRTTEPVEFLTVSVHARESQNVDSTVVVSLTPSPLGLNGVGATEKFIIFSCNIVQLEAYGLLPVTVMV